MSRCGFFPGGKWIIVKLAQPLGILAGGTAHSFLEGGGEASGIAEAHLGGNLQDRQLPVGQKIQTLGNPVVFQILGERLPGHPLEKAAAALLGHGGLAGNRFIETFWKSMKVELGKKDLLNEQTYRMVIEYYIYYYNNLRSHSSLGHLPPLAA